MVGLDMALSAWFDAVRADFELESIPVDGVDLAPGEDAYLDVSGAELEPYRPNPLFDGYEDREAPRVVDAGARDYADWEKLGEGRVVLTGERLIWQGPPRELEFRWERVATLALHRFNTLFLRYGPVPYRLHMGNEIGLKCMMYAATLLRKATADGRRKPAIGPY
jgi:hypothetical protein